MGNKPEHRVVACLLLALAVLSVYLPAAQLGFVNYDDPTYVSENPVVLGGLTPAGIKWAFTNFQSANWHPVTWISHMLDVQLFGSGPAAHHVINVLFHAGGTVLLFLLLEGMTSALWTSVFVAGLFALHPMHVESVAWISERKDVLSTFLGLLCLLAYAEYARGVADPSQSRRTRTFYGIAVGTLALGLMSKPMLVTWPFVMLLLDYWPLQRWSSLRASTKAASKSTAIELLVEKAPFFILSAASCVVTYVAQKSGGAVAPLQDIPISARLGNAVIAYVQYIVKLAWPSKLAFFYPYPQRLPSSAVAIAAVLLVAATLFVLWQARKRPYLFTGWFWYIGTLVPVIGLLQVGNQAIADRYTYVPAIGLFVALAWGLAEFAGASAQRRVIAGAAAAAMVLGCALVTPAQLRCWQNTEVLFRHTLTVTRNNFVAQNGLAGYLARLHETRQAEHWYRAALLSNPSSHVAWHGLGSLLIDEGKYDEAITNCAIALNLEPRMADAHCTLGIALMKKGKPDEAVAHYREALRLRPDYAPAHYNLANALAQQGQVDSACEHYRASLRLEPGSADAHNNLAYMLLRQGKWDEAIAEFNAALAAHPELWQARYGLADALVKKGDLTQAAAQLTTLLESRPQMNQARLQLGIVSAAQGKLEAAEALLSQATRLEPASAVAHYHLAVVLSRQGKKVEATAAAEKAQQLAMAGQPQLARKCEELLASLR